jgi:hypothetical protein
VRALVSMVVFVSCLATANSQQPFKVNGDYLEKEFGLKVTKFKHEPEQVVVTLEFTKDSDDVSKIRSLFGPKTVAKGGPNPAGVSVYAFDDENVAIQSLTIRGIMGEITGKTGDAFRVNIIGIQDVSRIRKIEFRPSPK